MMWLDKKLEMVQVHFTLDFEGLRDQKIWIRNPPDTFHVSKG